MATTLTLEPAELPPDAIEVGHIADAWGIKGWFKVVPYSANPEALYSAKRWYLQPSERGSKTFAGTALLSISNNPRVHRRRPCDRPRRPETDPGLGWIPGHR